MIEEEPSSSIHQQEEEEDGHKTFIDNQARLKYTERILKLVEKKKDVEDKLVQLRYETEQEDEEKEMGLKKLAEELQDVEKRIVEELNKSHSQLVHQLQLGEIKMSHLAERKGTIGSVPIRTSSVLTSPREEVSQTQSVSSLQSSSLQSSESEAVGLDSFFNTVLDFFSFGSPRPVAPTSSSDLSALEGEIAKLRAQIYQLEQKKNLSSVQLKSLKDTKEQLKLRIAQRERISREEYQL